MFVDGLLTFLAFFIAMLVPRVLVLVTATLILDLQEVVSGLLEEVAVLVLPMEVALRIAPVPADWTTEEPVTLGSVRATASEVFLEVSILRFMPFLETLATVVVVSEGLALRIVPLLSAAELSRKEVIILDPVCAGVF